MGDVSPGGIFNTLVDASKPSLLSGPAKNVLGSAWGAVKSTATSDSWLTSWLAAPYTGFYGIASKGLKKGAELWDEGTGQKALRDQMNANTQLQIQKQDQLLADAKQQKADANARDAALQKNASDTAAARNLSQDSGAYRRSTILTGPLGTPGNSPSGGGKTLLGM